MAVKDTARSAFSWALVLVLGLLMFGVIAMVIAA